MAHQFVPVVGNRNSTQQSRQCGFIAQSVEETDEQTHVVVGGKTGEDEAYRISALNYSAVLTYLVKSV